MVDFSKIIAHRGAWKDFGLPQNSIASFLKAQELPLGGIEFDLQFTKDEKIIVHHDDTYAGVVLCQTDFSTLTEIYRAKNEVLLSFNDLLQHWNQKKTLWVELKPANLNSVQKEKFVLEVLKQLGEFLKMVYFISFDLEIVRLLSIHSFCTSLYLGNIVDIKTLKENHANGWDPDVAFLLKNTSMIQQLKDEEMIINSWIVNDLEEAEKLISLGADFITTDEILLFLTER